MDALLSPGDGSGVRGATVSETNEGGKGVRGAKVSGTDILKCRPLNH